MFSTLRTKFGIPGIVSVIALVFALVGGAFAASNDGGGKATVSAKAKKGPRGPKGPKGDAGAPGSAGAPGPAGANGKDGAPGKDGTDGTDGGDGVSVTSAVLDPGEGGCDEGGVEYTSATGADIVCNGLEGKDGSEGSPWTLGGTLPAGETETGAWSLGSISAGAKPNEGALQAVVPISFPIPLASPLGTDEVHYIKPNGLEMKINQSFEEEEVTSTDCVGTVAAPAAEPGHFCLYVRDEESIITFSTLIFPPGETAAEWEGSFSANPANAGGTSTSGALLNVNVVAADAYAWGTWAVTSPTS